MAVRFIRLRIVLVGSGDLSDGDQRRPLPWDHDPVPGLHREGEGPDLAGPVPDASGRLIRIRLGDDGADRLVVMRDAEVVLLEAVGPRQVDPVLVQEPLLVLAVRAPAYEPERHCLPSKVVSTTSLAGRGAGDPTAQPQRTDGFDRHRPRVKRT